MTSTTAQSRTSRSAVIALLVFALSFVLVIYTLTHEAGHAIVGLLFGQTLTALQVNFLTLSAHVGLLGELTLTQRALQSLAGTGLPLVIWLILISCAPRRSSLFVEMLKCIASVTVLSTLLAWIILPVLYRFGQAPIDDVSNFLDVSKMEPLLLSFCALILYIAGWGWFLHKIQGIHSEMELFGTIDREVAYGKLRLPLAVTTSLLIAGTLVIVVLGSTLNPLAPPQGFQGVARLDLRARAYSDESLWQLTLNQPAKVGVYALVQNIDTTYFDLRLVGPAGLETVVLHGEDYTAEQDRVLWSRQLTPGQYQLVVTAHQTPGTVTIYLKDH